MPSLAGYGPAIALAVALITTLSLCAVLHRNAEARMRALVVLQLLLRRKANPDQDGGGHDEDRPELPPGR